MFSVQPDTKLDAKLVKDAIDWNEKYRQRYDKLGNYYLGEQDIFGREKADEHINNKVMINHAKYIVDVNTGYFLGSPVDYQVDEEVNLQPLLDNYRRQGIASLDVEISKDAAIYGMAYEYVYADEQARPNSVKLDVRNTVIIYDNTMVHNKLYGINYRPIFKKPTDVRPEYYDVIVATKTDIYKMELRGNGLKEVSSEKHAFGDVPILCYKNNNELQGDFEPVVSLIDAYNLIQSDRVNDREQLVDAILCFYGMRFDAEQMDELKIHRALSNIPADGKVEYLTKQVSEADADVLRQNLEKDIHKISMCPNMSDENFVGNASGVALRYKLLTFEQNIKNKERYFDKSLKDRLELYINFLATKSEMEHIPVEDIDIIFTRNLPSNDYETSQMINNLVGVVDKELLVQQLSFVNDASDVVDDEPVIDDKYAQTEITDRNITPVEAQPTEA